MLQIGQEDMCLPKCKLAVVSRVQFNRSHADLVYRFQITSGVIRVATTAASVSARRDMMAAICSGVLPGPQITSGKPVLAARHVSTYKSCQNGPCMAGHGYRQSMLPASAC